MEDMSCDEKVSIAAKKRIDLILRNFFRVVAFMDDTLCTKSFFTKCCKICCYTWSPHFSLEGSSEKKNYKNKFFC